jgi:hypothetical protein
MPLTTEIVKTLLVDPDPNNPRKDMGDAVVLEKKLGRTPAEQEIADFVKATEADMRGEGK